MLLAAIPAAAQAQPDFSDVRLKPGDFVYVTDPASRSEISGVVRSMTPRRIVVGSYEFVPVPGLKIERRGDTIADGAVIGFLVGGLAGSTLGREGCLHRSVGYCFLGGASWGAGLGTFIDWRHRGRTTVFRWRPS